MGGKVNFNTHVNTMNYLKMKSFFPLVWLENKPLYFGPIYLVVFFESLVVTLKLSIQQNTQISIQIYQICLSYCLMLSCISLSNKVFLSSSLQITISYLGMGSHFNVISSLLSQHYSYFVARVVSLSLLRSGETLLLITCFIRTVVRLQRIILIILKNVCLRRSPSITLNSGCRK